MYTQIFLVTSVRGMVLPPQIFANASLSFFGAKMPFPAFSAGHGLATADLRQRIAELLRGEDALPRLLHGSRILLGRCRLSLLASRLLRRRDLLQLSLRDGRLRGRGRHSDRGRKVQARL